MTLTNWGLAGNPLIFSASSYFSVGCLLVGAASSMTRVDDCRDRQDNCYACYGCCENSDGYGHSEVTGRQDCSAHAAIVRYYERHRSLVEPYPGYGVDVNRVGTGLGTLKSRCGQVQVICLSVT